MPCRSPSTPLPVLAGAAALALLAACGDARRGTDGGPLEARNRRTAAVALPPGYVARDTVQTYLGLLYPTGAPLESGFTQWERIQRAAANGPTPNARELAAELTDLTVQLFVDRRMLDPFGPTVNPTARGGAVELTRALSAFVDAPFDEAAFNARLGALVDVVPVPRDRTDSIIVSRPGLYKLVVPPGAFGATTTLTVEVLDAAANPLPSFTNGGPSDAVRSFPLFVQLSTSPAVSYRRPARIVLCTREPEDGGPAESVQSQLRVGHGFSPTETQIVPLAPRADVACDYTSGARLEKHTHTGLRAIPDALGAVLAAAWRMVGPRTAYAVHEGMGGFIFEATPFGVVNVGTTAPAIHTLAPADTTVVLSTTGRRVAFALSSRLTRLDATPVPGAVVTYIAMTPDVLDVTPNGLVRVRGVGEGWVAARASVPGERPVVGYARILVTGTP